MKKERKRDIFINMSNKMVVHVIIRHMICKREREKLGQNLLIGLKLVNIFLSPQYILL